MFDRNSFVNVYLEKHHYNRKTMYKNVVCSHRTPNAKSTVAGSNPTTGKYLVSTIICT